MSTQHTLKYKSKKKNLSMSWWHVLVLRVVHTDNNLQWQTNHNHSFSMRKEKSYTQNWNEDDCVLRFHMATKELPLRWMGTLTDRTLSSRDPRPHTNDYKCERTFTLHSSLIIPLDAEKEEVKKTLMCQVSNPHLTYFYKPPRNLLQRW